MAEDVRVSGPVAVQSDSRERVALELMARIANTENSSETSKREYWLKLYTQCYKATHGYAMKHILKDD